MLKVHPGGYIQAIEDYRAVLEPVHMQRSRWVMVAEDAVLCMQHAGTMHFFPVAAPAFIVYDPGENPFRPLPDYNFTLIDYLTVAGVSKEQVEYAFGTAYILDPVEFTLTPWGADTITIINMEELHDVKIAGDRPAV